jgi:hypothetical protein
VCTQHRRKPVPPPARSTNAQKSWLMRPRGFAGELGALTGRDCAHNLTGTGAMLAWQLWRSTRSLVAGKRGRHLGGMRRDFYENIRRSANQPSECGIGDIGCMYRGRGAAFRHGPRGCPGPHTVGPAGSQHSTRLRTRWPRGDGGYIPRGPRAEGKEPAGQSAAHYFSYSWGSLDSLYLGGGSGDASAP